MRNIYLRADKYVATDSLDHIYPHGTAENNSVNYDFNNRLFRWIPVRKLRVLDLGCSGGGFVRSIVDADGTAVGLEGSDYSKKNFRAEWTRIPDFLFTADITEPFELYQKTKKGNKSCKFNVITAWEVLEHIEEEKLNNVMSNIKKHLSLNGVVILSIGFKDDFVNGINLHRTVKPQKWWINFFEGHGFNVASDIINYFQGDWVRGGDIDIESFNIVLSKGAIPFRRRLKIVSFLDRIPLFSYKSEKSSRLRGMIDNGDYDGALKILERLEKKNILTVDQYFYYAYCLTVLEKNYSKAIEYYRKAEDENYNIFWVKYNRACLNVNSGFYEEAIRDLEDAVVENPFHTEAKDFLNQIKNVNNNIKN